LLDLDACPAPTSLHWFYAATDKPKNHRGDFEAQITNAELPVLRPELGNPPPPWFWGSTKKPTTGFEAKTGEIVATSFEVKLVKTVTAGFEAKPLETVRVVLMPNHSQTVATGFEAKPVKTVRVVLRPNHSRTVDLGFEAQPRNLRSSSPRVRCRPHTASPDRSATEYLTCATIPGPLH
jgi:hypothetical protein